MRILTAPITSLKWQDVLDFCALELPESGILDYKRDIPSELGRTVSAMANASGGLILIGVDEDRTSTKPILPPAGVLLNRGLPERIINVCITGIAPPVVPDIAVVEDPSCTLAVIVVRVLQSHQAPHAVARNTKVYIRRGSISSPENLATLDELDWLKLGRQRSLDFREALYANSEIRFLQFLRGFHGSNAKPCKVEEDGMLSLAFCPAYPKEMLTEPPDLRPVLRDIRIPDYYKTDYEFPLGSLNGTMVQDGFIVHASVNGGEWVHHTELNAFGLLFFKQSLLHPVQIGEERSRIIRASEIFCRLDEMFDCAKKFYERINFVSSLHFRMRLENLVGFPLGRYSLDENEIDLSFTPDNAIDFNAFLTSDGIHVRKPALILEAARRVAWAFDWDVQPALLDKYYGRHKGEQVIGETAV